MTHIGTQSIQTSRLLLRKISVADAEDMYRNWASDAKVTRFLTWLPHENMELTKNMLAEWEEIDKKPDSYRWCIELKENRQAIGTIDIVRIDPRADAAEIGYCMAEAHWGKGMMTEALKAVIDFCFGEVGFHRVEANHFTENIASGKVMRKSGMQYEGTRRQGCKNGNGVYCDQACYAILKSDWENQIKA